MPFQLAKHLKAKCKACNPRRRAPVGRQVVPLSDERTSMLDLQGEVVHQLGIPSSLIVEKNLRVGRTAWCTTNAKDSHHLPSFRGEQAHLWQVQRCTRPRPSIHYA